MVLQEYNNLLQQSQGKHLLEGDVQLCFSTSQRNRTTGKITNNKLRIHEIKRHKNEKQIAQKQTNLLFRFRIENRGS
jgi:hypothetical protein